MLNPKTKKGSIIFENILFDSQAIDSSIKDIIELYKHNMVSIEKPIGIALNRTQQLIIAILAALDYGVPFLPIDLSLPVERINYMLTNSGINTVLTSQSYSKLFANNVLIYSHDNKKSNLQYKPSKQNELAYVLYTSGSTGIPKGVQVRREGVVNFIDGISEIIDFSAGKRIACLTTVSFDIFFLESITALYKGLTVVLANEEEQHNPKLMAKLIRDNDVDMIQMTPSRMQLLLNHDKELSCLKNVSEIMIGGEPFPLSLLRTLQEKTTAKIYNMYGPTETTIWSTVSDLTNKNHIDIGRPIKNTEIYIVDENQCILPDGQDGEICIAGKGLAKGYVGRDDLTTEKFIYLPQKPDIRVYRTGDLGRYLADSNLEYLGRNDNQIKIRGHRIELEEIELHLNQIEGIKQSVVIALETSENDRVLEAFYTSEISIDSKAISDYLSSKIPSYMIPGIFKYVKEFIQTANGKIDRKRVLECVEIKVNCESQKAISDGLTEIQKKALDVIVSNLDAKVLDNVSLNMNFASVGLDSITFIKVIVALEGEFNFEFDDEMLLITAFPTIKSMIDYVDSKIL